MSPLVDEFQWILSIPICMVDARVRKAILRGGCYPPSASTKQRRYPCSPQTPYTPEGVQPDPIGSQPQVLLRDGYVPEDIITTLEQASGFITTTDAPNDHFVLYERLHHLAIER